LNPKQRLPIPEDTKRRLLLYIRYECCLCDSKISGKRESNIHHINRDPSDNRIENLIPLCPNCHAKADRGDYPEDHLKAFREAKIRKLGIKKVFEKVTEPAIAFKTLFTSKLDECINLIEKKTYTDKLNDLIDELIMLIKERIERWDVPSVRFSTKELFLKLYRYSGKEGFCDLYVIYRDLFNYAYSQRKHILGVMIHVFYFILFESWVPEYDVEKAEKASEVLLKLGLDFLKEDLEVTESCFTSIDNLAGDMFEPEILSKEIILGARVYEEKSSNPMLKDFLKHIVECIQTNDEYAWDDENYTYLIDSIKYAEFEQNKYSINIEAFKKHWLFPAIEQNIDERVQGFIDFLAEPESEGRENTDFHTRFTTELLARLILSYESVRPKIAEEIKQEVKDTNNSYVLKEIEILIDNSNLLKKIYRGSEMITTFDELIRFLETNSDMENLGIGVTTYSFAMIDFTQRLDEEAENILLEIAKKYGTQEDFEVTDQGIHFEMDHLVYIGNNKNDMRKLIEFLKEVNSKFKVKNFSTGITFNLREI
jgi:hypothetical protein